MTIGVVEALEVIQIKHGDDQWLPIALAAAQFAWQGFDEIAAVEQPGERIADRLFL